MFQLVRVSDITKPREIQFIKLAFFQIARFQIVSAFFFKSFQHFCVVTFILVSFLSPCFSDSTFANVLFSFFFFLCMLFFLSCSLVRFWCQAFICALFRAFGFRGVVLPAFSLLSCRPFWKLGVNGSFSVGRLTVRILFRNGRGYH